METVNWIEPSLSRSALDGRGAYSAGLRAARPARNGEAPGSDGIRARRAARSAWLSAGLLSERDLAGVDYAAGAGY